MSIQPTQEGRQRLLLILLWEQEKSSATDQIRTKFPQFKIVYFCLQTASKRLLEESSTATSGVRPARYVFTQLLSDDSRDLDSETIPARQELKALLHEASILVSLSLLPPSVDLAPNIQGIHLLSAGIDLITESVFYKETSVEITTSSGIHGVPIAEWVAMGILGFRKQLLSAHDLQKKHQWPVNKSSFSQYGSLQGTKVGVLGYGSIGRQVARILSAFGCNIIVSTASPRPNEQSRRDSGYVMTGTGDPIGAIPCAWFSGTDKASLHEFLSQGLDILVLSTPLTAATEELLSTKEFDTLSQHTSSSKNKCFLVNVSRGRVIDQPALVAALEDGRLAGAALDVTSPEPLPSRDPLWNARNVTITPHISTLGPDFTAGALGVLVANLERQERGEKPFNLVDREKGY